MFSDEQSPVSDQTSPVFEQKSHVSGKATIWRDYHNLAGSQDAQLEQSWLRCSVQFREPTEFCAYEDVHVSVRICLYDIHIYIYKHVYI